MANENTTEQCWINHGTVGAPAPGPLSSGAS